VRLLLCVLLGLFGAAASFAEDSQQKPLIVYGDDWTFKKAGPVHERQMMQTIQRVRAFMERTGLAYEMRFPPRPRKMALFIRREPALFFEFLRTPARENQLEWILPLGTQYVFEAFTMRTSRAAGMTVDQILESDLIGVCEVEGTNCHLMEDMGLPPERIMAIPLNAATDMERLVLAGRADFLLSTQAIMRRNIETLKLDPSIIVSLGQVASFPGYLVAPKGFDPERMKTLMNTPQDGLPVID